MCSAVGDQPRSQTPASPRRLLIPYEVPTTIGPPITRAGGPTQGRHLPPRAATQSDPFTHVTSGGMPARTAGGARPGFRDTFQLSFATPLNHTPAAQRHPQSPRCKSQRNRRPGTALHGRSPVEQQCISAATPMRELCSHPSRKKQLRLSP